MVVGPSLPISRALATLDASGQRTQLLLLFFHAEKRLVLWALDN